MDKFTTQQTFHCVQKVLDPIIIYEGVRTRCVFFAQTNDAKLDKGETVSGYIIHQKKKDRDEWEDINEESLRNLKSGEGIKLQFDSEQIKRFYDGLQKIYAISEKGVQLGKHDWVVAEAGRIIEVPRNRIEFIRQLLKQNHGEEVWKQLVADNPDLATRLSFSRIQEQRQTALEEFQNNLTDNKEENIWQEYFISNTWIFGYGLKYVFLRILQSQPSYGGSSFTGKGNQKGDFLCNTEANIRFTVLVEIKRPNTSLFKLENGNPKSYRNGVCQLSEEFIGAVSQLQVNCSTWEKESKTEENIEQLSTDKTYTVNPKGILIIGNTAQFNGNSEARNTFESFRSHLTGIDIITFDELLERAKFIVINSDTNAAVFPVPEAENDCPF
jgi:hypothetical protein